MHELKEDLTVARWRCCVLYHLCSVRQKRKPKSHHILYMRMTKWPVLDSPQNYLTCFSHESALFIFGLPCFPTWGSGVKHLAEDSENYLIFKT